MTPFHVIIPARYGSSRLSGKPLADIAGKPMIWHVMDIARKSGATETIVATDDKRIVEVVEGFGGKAVMTSPDHESGTDRIAEACQIFGIADTRIVVNLQGDEPLMPPGAIAQVVELLATKTDASMATLCAPVESAEQFVDPAVVKVVLSEEGFGMYFSRAPIPWVRGDGSSALVDNAWQTALHHLGLYAYTSGYLRSYAKRPVARLEQLERLEQLRVLAGGDLIACVVAEEAPPAGVDSDQDLARVRAVLAARQGA